MELLNAIKNRRSIRKFTEKVISDEILNDLINVASLAPSAKNRQPWLFKVANKVQKDKIADIMIDYYDSLNNDSKKIELASIKATANSIKQASSLILIYHKLDNYLIEGDLLSIGAAIENMSLRATDLNIGTLWIGNTRYVKDEINEFLNIEGLNLISALAIGYKAYEPSARPRKKIEEIIIGGK